ncbi:MAG TPA: hypothetical protein VKB79_24980 [Bryobacteraceae bacterium]|nr:hypothetical protein [Bryobacteraceae bacterium]
MAEPYPGPVPFDKDSKAYFFGRSKEARDVSYLLIARQAVLLYGPAGAGVTSLLQAAILPHFEDSEELSVLPTIRVASAINEGGNIYLANAVRALGGSGEDLEAAIRNALKGRNAPWLLIIDQFEEIFSFHPELRDDRRRFFEELRRCLEAIPKLSILLAMREEYLADIDACAVYFPDRLRSRMRLDRLTISQAVEAIEEPARAVNKPFDPGVAKALADNLSLTHAAATRHSEARGAEPRFVEPVQLQIVCQHLWSHLKPEATKITEEDRKNCTVDDVLAVFYNNAVRAAVATGISERKVRQWLERKLISPAGIRLLATTDGITQAAAESLCAAHIIRETDRDGYYELAHDRMIDPIRQSNFTWLTTVYRNPVAPIIAAGRKDMLLDGNQLEEARKYRDQNPQELTEEENDFLEKSIEQVERFRRERERERRRRRNLTLAAFVVLLVVAALSLLAAARARETLIVQLAQTAIRLSHEQPDAAALVALQAEHESPWIPILGTRAKNAVTSALLAATLDHDARYITTVQEPEDQPPVDCLWFDRASLQVARGKDKSRAEVDWSKRSLSPRSARHGSLPSRCAKEALGIFPRQDLPLGWSAVVNGDQLEITDSSARPPAHWRRPVGGHLRRIAIDPIYQRVAWVLDNRHDLYVADLRTGQTYELHYGDLPPLAIRFSPDGNILAAGGRDSLIRLWYFGAHQPEKSGLEYPFPSRPLAGHSDTILDLEFSPDSATFLSAAADNLIIRWRVLGDLFLPPQKKDPEAFIPGKLFATLTGGPPRQLEITEAGQKTTVDLKQIKRSPRFLALSPEGAHVAIGFGGGGFAVADLRSGRTIENPSAEPELQILAVNSGGKLIAAADQSADPAEILVWDIQNNSRPKYSWRTGTGTIQSLAFHPGDSLLASGDDRNGIHFWRLTSQGSCCQEERPPLALSRTPFALAFSPDGKWIAALDELNEVKIWDVATRSPLGGYLQLPGDPSAIAFAPDGKSFHVLMNGVHELAVNWTVATDNPSAFNGAACALLPPDLYARRLIPVFSVSNWRPPC